MSDKMKLPPKFPTFVFKLSWQSTAKTVKIKARDLEHAQRLVAREVKRTDGGAAILDVHFLEERP